MRVAHWTCAPFNGVVGCAATISTDSSPGAAGHDAVRSEGAVLSCSTAAGYFSLSVENASRAVRVLGGYPGLVQPDAGRRGGEPDVVQGEKPSACQVSADSYTDTFADSETDTISTSRQTAVIAAVIVSIQPGLTPVMYSELSPRRQASTSRCFVSP